MTQAVSITNKPASRPMTQAVSITSKPAASAMTQAVSTTNKPADRDESEGCGGLISIPGWSM